MGIATAQLVTTATVLLLHAPDSSMEIISLHVLQLTLSLLCTLHTLYIPRLKYGILHAYIE
jgi:hypothetical protein